MRRVHRFRETVNASKFYFIAFPDGDQPSPATAGCHFAWKCARTSTTTHLERAVRCSRFKLIMWPMFWLPVRVVETCRPIAPAAIRKMPTEPIAHSRISWQRDFAAGNGAPFCKPIFRIAHAERSTMMCPCRVGSDLTKNAKVFGAAFGVGCSSGTRRPHKHAKHTQEGQTTWR